MANELSGLIASSMANSVATSSQSSSASKLNINGEKLVNLPTPHNPLSPTQKDIEIEEFQKKIQGPGKLDALVNRANDLVQNIRRELRFTLEEDSGKTVVKVIDSETGEVIRQFPSDELLKLAKSLEQAGGILIKEEV